MEARGGRSILTPWRRGDIVCAVTDLHASVRRAVCASVPLAVTALLFSAAPANADAAEGWSDPDPVNWLEALLLLGGVPILMFLVLAAMVYGPALARGEKVTPGAAEDDPEWIGGPRAGTRELAAAEDDDVARTGGASGSW